MGHPGNLQQEIQAVGDNVGMRRTTSEYLLCGLLLFGIAPYISIPISQHFLSTLPDRVGVGLGGIST